MKEQYLDEEFLRSHTVAQLRSIAKGLRIDKYYSLRKEELISEIVSVAKKGIEEGSKEVSFLSKIVNFFRENWGVISGVAVLLTIVIHSLNIFSFFAPDNSIKAVKSTPVRFDNDSMNLKILLLPFHPDKNCLIESVAYEEQLLERFENLIAGEDIPILIKLEKNQVCPKSEKEALDYAVSINADLIIWGRYEEECDGEDKVCIQYSFTEDSKLHKGINRYGSTGLHTLESASQLRTGFLQEDIDYIIYWTIAMKQFREDDFVSTLKWLNKVSPKYSCDSEISLLKGLSYLLTRQVEQAKLTFKTQIECDPNDPTPYYFLAESYARVFSTAYDSDSIVKHYLTLAVEADSTYFPARIEKAYYELGTIGQKTFRGAVSMEFSENPNDMENMRLMYLNKVFSFKISTLDSTTYERLIEFTHENYYQIIGLLSQTDSSDIIQKEKYSYYLGLLYSFQGDVHQLARRDTEAIRSYGSSIFACNIFAGKKINPQYFYFKKDLEGEVRLKRALIYSMQGKKDSMNMDLSVINNIARYTEVDYNQSVNRIRNQEQFLESTISFMSMKPDTVLQLK